MDDLVSIRRIKRGDIGGLEMLMTRYQVKAVRAAFLITYDQAMAQDIVQEVFIRIYQCVRQFDEAQPFEPYLIRSVINASLNSIRDNRKFISLDYDTQEAIEYLLDHADSVEMQVESNQLQQDILDALSKLSPRQRAVIIQRYYLDMSEREMTHSLDIAPGTVKWLLNAARGHLRHLLGQKGVSDE